MLIRKEECPKLFIHDLDGTLSHSEISVVPAMTEVFLTFSLPVPSDEALLAFVGEPFANFLEW